MKVIKQLMIGIALITSTVVSAQSNLKFGHVNTLDILNIMPEMKTIDEQLKGEYDKLEAQLTDMQEALKTLQQDYVSKLQAQTLTNEARAEMETQIQEGNKKVQDFYTQSQKSLQQKEQELKMPVFDKLSNAIKEVGDENGFLYIFEGQGGLAVYKSEKSIDVAPLVKAKLGIQ